MKSYPFSTHLTLFYPPPVLFPTLLPPSPLTHSLIHNSYSQHFNRIHPSHPINAYDNPAHHLPTSHSIRIFLNWVIYHFSTRYHRLLLFIRFSSSSSSSSSWFPPYLFSSTNSLICYGNFDKLLKDRADKRMRFAFESKRNKSQSPTKLPRCLFSYHHI